MKRLLILLILLFALPAYAQQCSEENPCPELARLTTMMGSTPVAAGAGYLGYAGATTLADATGAGAFWIAKLQATATGSISTAHLFSQTECYAGDAHVVVYSAATQTAAGAPSTGDALLGSSLIITDGLSCNSWHTNSITIAGGVTSGTWYWIGYFCRSSTGRWDYATAETMDTYYKELAASAPPATLGTGWGIQEGFGPGRAYVD